MDLLTRHIAACNNAVLPGQRLPFMVAGQQVGWLDPALLPTLLDLGALPHDGGVALAPDLLQPAARALANAGRFRWRDEPFDVRATPDGPVLAQIDRGALPGFGIQAAGVHLNGLVQRPDGLHLWVARRAQDKLMDPGKLDHLVAGGVPAGMSPADTLLKEAEEEASLPPALLRHVRHVGIIDYTMDRDEGLRRDRLHCYDVMLPEDFQPAPRDGEVESFELWPVRAALERVRATDDFKFNVNLVLIDLFNRLGLTAA
jgi:8-oxo-dGTP pyrophosphatase MutT (NUDIX family)